MKGRPGREAGRVLRRPSDLVGEGGAPAPGSAIRSRAFLEWPPGFARASRDRLSLMVLLGLASMTARRLLELAQAHPTASACLLAIGSGEAGSASDRSAAASADPAAVSRRVDRVGARLVAVHDPAYPRQLVDLFDPPAGLFVRGELAPDQTPLGGEPPGPGHPGSTIDRSVAIVGARNCSPGGAEAARSLGRGLARSGFWVVSGAARGIDAAAHEGALDEGGRTVAVLGSGIDIPYPRQNAGLIERIAASGAVTSEYPPGVPAEPFRFPARNRIVAALAAAVVIVEGAEGSGSLITAEHALDLGREVFAVPGPITSELSWAPLRLIREGATMIRGPDDLLEDMGAALPGRVPQAADAGGAAPRFGPGDEGARAVWEAMRGPTAPDALAAATGLSLARVMAGLTRLELRGAVRSVGGRFERRATG